MTTVNLVANGSFATGDLTDCALGGNYATPYYGIFISAAGEGEGATSYAAILDSSGSAAP
jgi:hypothetical protein